MPAGSPCWVPSRLWRAVVEDEGAIGGGAIFLDKTGFGGEALQHPLEAACVEGICCFYADHDVRIMGVVRINSMPAS